jgi:hypothetical protein
MRRYRLDFDLFGYSPDEYIAVGRPDPDDTTTAQPAEASNFFCKIKKEDDFH